MKGFLLCLILLETLQSYSQKDIYCQGLEKLGTKSLIVISGYEQQSFIKKGDLMKSNLWIVLSDTTYKVLGFIATYDCHSSSLVDINEKKYFGNRIKSADWFINAIRVGDMLTLDCINVIKNGKQYLIASKSFKIVD